MNAIQRLREHVRNSINSSVEASNQWSENRKEFARCILEEDISNFLNWNIVRGRMTYEPSKAAVEFLQKQPDWNEWEKALVRSPVGNPPYYAEYPKSCGNLITQANHLTTLFTETSSSLKDFDTVFEFGGGFGNMCRLIYNRGFSGKYIILDLPEICALQEYYISSAMPSKTLRYGEIVESVDISLLFDKEVFKRQLKEKSESLFFALWSLSESPISLRDEIFEVVCDSVKCILIGYQDEWYGYDNVRYFKSMTEKYSKYVWKIKTAPVFGHKLTYVIGKRK